MIELTIDGKKRNFDMDDPNLPDWVKDEAFASGGYSHEKQLKRKDYE